MSDWHPIATAPENLDLEVCIYDRGEYHALVFPCRREGAVWRDMRLSRPMLIAPTHWRPWPCER